MEVINDFKKDNSLEILGEDEEFKSTDNINWKLISNELKSLYEYLEKNEGKKIIKKIQDISEREVNCMKK